MAISLGNAWPQKAESDGGGIDCSQLRTEPHLKAMDDATGQPGASEQASASVWLS